MECMECATGKRTQDPDTEEYIYSDTETLRYKAEIPTGVPLITVTIYQCPRCKNIEVVKD